MFVFVCANCRFYSVFLLSRRGMVFAIDSVFFYLSAQVSLWKTALSNIVSNTKRNRETEREKER